MTVCERCDQGFDRNHHSQKFCDPCKIPAKNERNRLRAAERWSDPVERETLKATARRHRAKNIAILNLKARERAESVRRFINSVKITAGCADCGYKERAIALDFDHLRDKTQIIAHCRTIHRASEEMEKCEVVCANCHRIRTEDRGTFGHRRQNAQ
jgi:hypothetical protein